MPSSEKWRADSFLWYHGTNHLPQSREPPSNSSANTSGHPAFTGSNSRARSRMIGGVVSFTASTVSRRANASNVISATPSAGRTSSEAVAVQSFANGAHIPRRTRTLESLRLVMLKIHRPSDATPNVKSAGNALTGTRTCPARAPSHSTVQRRSDRAGSLSISTHAARGAASPPFTATPRRAHAAVRDVRPKS